MAVKPRKRSRAATADRNQVRRPARSVHGRFARCAVLVATMAELFSLPRDQSRNWRALERRADLLQREAQISARSR